MPLANSLSIEVVRTRTDVAALPAANCFQASIRPSVIAARSP